MNFLFVEGIFLVQLLLTNSFSMQELSQEKWEIILEEKMAHSKIWSKNLMKFHIHHLHDQAKVFQNNWPYFWKYICSSLILQEVVERHKNGVLGPPGPFAYANQPLIVLGTYRRLLRLPEITGSVVPVSSFALFMSEFSKNKQRESD